MGGVLLDAVSEMVRISSFFVFPCSSSVILFDDFHLAPSNRCAFTCSCSQISPFCSSVILGLAYSSSATRHQHAISPSSPLMLRIISFFASRLHSPLHIFSYSCPHHPHSFSIPSPFITITITIPSSSHPPNFLHTYEQISPTDRFPPTILLANILHTAQHPFLLLPRLYSTWGDSLGRRR